MQNLKKFLKNIVRKVKKVHVSKNFLLFVGAGILIFAALFTIWISTIKLPDFNSFEEQKLVNSTKIYDRTGQILLYDIHQDVRRTNIPFEQMGDNIKHATVAIEDWDFYNHNGIRVSSIARAILSNLFHLGKTQGGSTITQQLVKNTLLNSRKSYARKIKEWVLAVKVDNELSKDKILELYLNEVPYGGTIYGIEEASQVYFNKKAADITVAESAYLASIPQSPTVLSPYGKNKARLDDRKNLVLGEMKNHGYLTKEQYDQAKAEVVTFQPQAVGGIKAPHFVFFIKDYLEQKYGAESIAQGGLKVITTLDYDLEAKAEEIVKAGALSNEKTYNGKNASLVAIDPKTGQILSMVGSRDYFDKEIDGNFNVATANRQPGSSFKPFIYATAFTEGFTPDTVLFDVPTEFQTTCDAYGKATAGHSQSDCYKPADYDGKYRGPMTLRNALAQSINIPAVKLFYLAGVKTALKTAEDMGISSLSRDGRYGLTLVIGGGEVSPLDITSAYSVFANNGVREPYTGVLQVQDSKGNILEQYAPNEKEVLPKNVALTISDVLSDNVARTPTFGANSVLVVSGHQVAVKTGTTNNNKDAWTVGYSPSISVGVWTGNNNNTAMKAGGGTVAGPIWNKFMAYALSKYPTETFEKPDLSVNTETKPILRGSWMGNDTYFIDKISGKLATSDTPDETKEERIVTNIHSILYWVNKNDITGPPPVNPGSDPQYEHWEVPVQNWWAQNREKYPEYSASAKPTETDDIHTSGSLPTISISEPNSETVYLPEQKINLKVTSTGIYPLNKIDVYVNDNYLGSSKAPFNYSFVPSDVDNIDTDNTIRVIGYDSAYNRSETTSTFKVKQ